MTLAHTRFPSTHRMAIRINSVIDWLGRKIHRRTCLAGSVFDGRSASMLFAVRAQVCGEERIGFETLPGCDTAGRVVAPGGGLSGLS